MNVVRVSPWSTVGRRIRHPIVAASFALLALAGACDDPTAPLPSEGPPDELRFVYGGFMVDVVTLELQGTTVATWRRPAEWRPGDAIDTVRVVPTAPAWRQFWIDAERAGVHRWRSRYIAEDVVDGNGWGLRLVAGRFSLESTGSNAYPDRRGGEHELEMTEAFASLVDALGELVGRPLRR